MSDPNTHGPGFEIVATCDIDELFAKYAASRKRLPDPTPIKPGSDNASTAYRAGVEDEYIDRMETRHGGEW
jgi:hypothetical protein